MKVILLTDVPKVGNRYEVKEFKDGYARNVLIAKGLAILATPKALIDLNKKKSEMTNKKKEEDDTFNSLLNNIKSKKIILKVKANEKGHLFKGIGPRDVVKGVLDTLKLEIEENMINMDHIKELGSYSIKIKNGDLEGAFDIEIIAE